MDKLEVVKTDVEGIYVLTLYMKNDRGLCNDQSFAIHIKEYINNKNYDTYTSKVIEVTKKSNIFLPLDNWYKFRQYDEKYGIIKIVSADLDRYLYGKTYVYDVVHRYGDKYEYIRKISYELFK